MKDLPFLHNNPHILLQMDPRTERLPRLEWIGQCEFKLLEERDEDLVQLDHCDWFTQTLVPAIAKYELVIVLHGAEVVEVGLVAAVGRQNPALGAKAVGVGSEEGG